jgi:hypothetical protein
MLAQMSSGFRIRDAEIVSLKSEGQKLSKEVSQLRELLAGERTCAHVR